MDVWKYSGISNKTNNHKSYEKAVLLVKAEDEILPKKFNYETVADEAYQESSGIIGEMTIRTKTIFTPNYWLPFVKGAKVRFESGEELTIKTITEVKDAKKALGLNRGLLGLQIIF